jgi:hypothetical protein
MQYELTQRRADFEAWATDHYAEFGAVPNFTRSTKQSHNYTDLNPAGFLLEVTWIYYHRMPCDN